jgi:hypothetical protein
MRRRLLLGAIGLVCVCIGGVAAAAPRSASTPPPWCRDTSDLLAQRFLAQLLDLATSDEPGPVAERQSLQGMPKFDSSTVWLITDDSLCQRASAALDSGLYTSPRGYQVLLAHVGSRHVAFPPSDSTINFGYWVHLDSTFKVLMWSKY